MRSICASACCGAARALAGQRLEPRSPGPDQRELGGDEQPVDHHEQQQEDEEQDAHGRRAASARPVTGTAYVAGTSRRVVVVHARTAQRYQGLWGRIRGTRAVQAGLGRVPDGCPGTLCNRRRAPRRRGARAHSEQDQTPYLDAIVEYAQRGPGPLPRPRATRADTGRTPRRSRRWARRPSTATSRRGSRASTSAPTPPSSALNGSPPSAWGARRSWFLINGASQGNHATCLALRHARPQRRRPAQRPLEHDRRDHPRGARADLRRAGARRRARDRPLPDPGGARRGARSRPGCGRGADRVSDLLRRGRRRRRAGGGLPRPRPAAGRRRGLGLSPAVLAPSARERPGVRRRPRPVLDPQAARQPHPVGDPPPGRQRARSTRTWSTAA